MPRLPRLSLFCLYLSALPVHAQDLHIGAELAHGGAGIFVIGALSALALGVTFERLVNFRLAKVAPPALAMHHVFRNRMVGIGIALERQLNRVLDGMPARTLEVVHAH